MKILNCPMCRRLALISTGAFWNCTACNMAITSQALCREPQQPVRETRQRRGTSHINHVSHHE